MTKQTKPEHGAKAKFIRAQPKDMPAAEVVAKAKAAGLTVTIGQVYTTRAQAKPALKQAPTSGLLDLQKYVARVGTEQAKINMAAAIRAIEQRVGL